MKYLYSCKQCDSIIEVVRESRDRAKNLPACKCGCKELTRKFYAPDNSKLIGALRASEKDGVGVLIDAGHINRPVSRGSSDTRKKTWQKDRTNN
jgi:hypothetical protein